MNIEIDWYSGSREELRPLFELADDSPSQLDQYIERGQILVARDGQEVIGHLQLVRTARRDEIELKNMAVAPERQGNGLGRVLVLSASSWCETEGLGRMIVATAAADVGNLRFYQRLGFRFLAVERNAFTPTTGYPDPIEIDGIPLMDRVWLAQDFSRSASAEAPTSSGSARSMAYAGTPPTFCDTELAARIERAEADLTALASAAAHRRTAASLGRTGFVLPIAGGVASFAEKASPFNKIAGLGFQGIPTDDELQHVERAFAEHRAPVQVELSSLADPAIGGLLTGRGYRLESFENVLGRDLSDRPQRVSPAGIEVRTSGDDELDTWLQVVIAAAEQPDTEGVPWHEEFPREILENAERDVSGVPGAVRYLARSDGVVAGGASLRLVDGLAQLTGAGTVAAYRRRGVQTALTSVRLADAVAAGCDLAVVTTQPGSKSHQNVQRSGFDLLYTRAILVKST